MERVLQHFLGDRHKAGLFVDEVSAAGKDVMKEAQALQQLADRFGRRGDALSPESKLLLDRMASDHLRAVREKVDSIRGLIAPLYREDDLRAPGSRPTAIEGREAESPHIFQLARELNGALQRLSTHGATADTGGSEIGDIAVAFRALQARLTGSLNWTLAVWRARADYGHIVLSVKSPLKAIFEAA